MEQTSYEPVQNDEHIILPRDLFKNHLTFFLSELSHGTLFKAWFSVYAIIIFITIICIVRGSRFELIFFLGVASVVLLIIGFIPFSLFAQTSLNLDSKLKFLNEVIVNKPNLDMSTWDIICQHMNSFMYTNTYWSTPYYFFDGKSCYRVFQNMVLRKYLGTSTATEESDSDDSPENFNGSFYNYEDRNVLKYMRKAKVVYDESVEQYLKTRYPDYDI